MTVRKIAIIGATGMLGQPVAKMLIASGFQVRALVRDVEKARRLLPAEIELVQADLKNPVSLESGISGCEGLYLNLQIDQESRESDWAAEREGIDNALAAAKKQGVHHVAYLSSIIKDDPQSADWWVYKAKVSAADKVKNSGIPWTVFCPSCFMENLSHLQIENGKLMAISGTGNKNYWISGNDYGRMVAAAFRNEVARNKEYWIQGPEGYDTGEASNVFLKNYSKQSLKLQAAPLGMLKVISLFTGPKMRYMVKIMNSVTRMPEPFKGEAAWNDLHKPAETIASYAKRISV